MADLDEYLQVTRGGNISFRVDFAEDVTGKTFEAFEVSPVTMADGWTFTVFNAAAGQVDVSRPWGSGEPSGTGHLASLTVRSTDGAFAAGPIPLWFV